MSEIALTKRGVYALLKALAGEAALRFERVQLGNGRDAGADAGALSNPLLTAMLEQATIVDDFVQLTIKFNNASVETGFTANEIGILIADPDTPDESLLYAYGYYKDSEADYIPSGLARPIETTMTFLIYVGEAQNVSATLSQSLVYAAKQDLEEHVSATGNVHKLTAKDIGLENAETVGVNDMTPTYKEATALTALENGEKLSTAFGKLAKAVSSLIAHIKDGVAHITADERIAWNAKADDNHVHAANDINSGTLGIARGGTGANTVLSAINALLAKGVGVDIVFNATNGVLRGVKGTVATNDQWRVVGGGADNSGYLEIATADDGSEPVYVRQYSGAFVTAVRTLTLLDASGDTYFPGVVYGQNNGQIREVVVGTSTPTLKEGQIGLVYA